MNNFIANIKSNSGIKLSKQTKLIGLAANVTAKQNISCDQHFRFSNTSLLYRNFKSIILKIHCINPMDLNFIRFPREKFLAQFADFCIKIMANIIDDGTV